MADTRKKCPVPGCGKTKPDSYALKDHVLNVHPEKVCELYHLHPADDTSAQIAAAIHRKWLDSNGDASPEDLADAAMSVVAPKLEALREDLRYWKTKLAAVTDGRDNLTRETTRLRTQLEQARTAHQNAAEERLADDPRVRLPHELPDRAH